MFKGETEEELQWEFAWIREKNGFGINQSEWGTGSKKLWKYALEFISSISNHDLEKSATGQLASPPGKK